MQTLSYVSVAPKLVKHPCASPRRRRTIKHDGSRVLSLAVTITLGILLAIGVPLAAILPQKYVRQLPINIIVPLYFHPDPGAWDRLYAAILRHPDNNFTLIVNPSSGPGAPPLPSTLYIDAISRLHAYSNVKVIGYINTAGGDRESTSVMQEIETYAGWSKKRGLAMDGIFFDQTPAVDSSEKVHYMKNISATVAHSEGFSAPRLVIQNPGTMSAPGLIDTYVDVTIVFEGRYESVPNRDTLKKELAALHGRRENYGVLIHSMPTRTSHARLRRLINSLKKDVKYVYITDLEEDVYEGFGDSWEDFMKLIW